MTTSSRSKTTTRVSIWKWPGCSKSSLFPPRKPAIPEPGDWELNRGRVELRFVAGCEPTDPEQVGFPSARQIAAVTRMVIRKDKKSNETVRLITSLDASKASGTTGASKASSTTAWTTFSTKIVRGCETQTPPWFWECSAALSSALPFLGARKKRRRTNASQPVASWSISMPTTTAAPSISSPPRPLPHGKIRKNQP